MTICSPCANNKTKILKYRKYMFMYGLLSVLYALEWHEARENYEECGYIVDAIREQETRLGITLGTRITSELIQTVIDGYKPFGLTGKNAVENSRYYSELIIEETK